MTEILAFIARHMGFLWTGARFRVVGSGIDNSNGGDAYLLVESSVLRLRFVRDRGQLLLEFQPSDSAVNEWFSVDLIRRLWLGERESSGILDEGYAKFIEGHLEDIEASFGSEMWSDTHLQLKQLKRVRAKELFG